MTANNHGRGFAGGPGMPGLGIIPMVMRGAVGVVPAPSVVYILTDLPMFRAVVAQLVAVWVINHHGSSMRTGMASCRFPRQCCLSSTTC